MKILVTGGHGFIGSAAIRHILSATKHSVVNVDKLTYAANPDALAEIDDPRHAFHRVDIRDREALRQVFAQTRPDCVMHLAAETHVDRSIDGPAAFIETNVVGTFELLRTALAYWQELEGEAKARFRFHHVSTDEVYGSLGPDGSFTEETAYAPRSPYSASKAGADHLAAAWHHTYGLPVLFSNTSNNYGPWQFPEKLIPLAIVKALRGEPIPVYGDGRNVRDWLYVEDHAAALLDVLTRAAVGSRYNIGGRSERTNREVVEAICAILDRLAPQPGGQPHAEAIRFVPDRPGHDLRYAIDCSRIERDLGWRPLHGFAEGLERTVRWYLDHRPWWEGIMATRYDGERLGQQERRAAAAGIARG